MAYPAIIPLASQVSSLEMMLGSNNQKCNHIITFQEILYWKQSYKLKEQSRGKKKKSFHLVHEYFR